MLPLKLWIHFTPIAVCTLYHVTIEVVNSLPTHSRVYSVPVKRYKWCSWCLKLWIHFQPIAGCILYHVTIEVVNSLHTHSSGYSVSCYHWSCEFTSHPYQGVLCTMLPLKLWIHFPPITGCTLYHVTIEVVNSLPTHNRMYSVPCYHWSCEFTSHP
jgi:hypothetical protein